MSNFVVYLDTSEIRPGELGKLKVAMAQLASFVEAHEPRIIAYNVYFSGDGSRMSVLHIHEDVASLEFHMTVAGPQFPPVAPLVKLLTIEIFGAVNDAVLEQLKTKAQLLGGTVIIHDLGSGFARVRAG
jgi:hypothetical protein